MGSENYGNYERHNSWGGVGFFASHARDSVN